MSGLFGGSQPKVQQEQNALPTVTIQQSSYGVPIPLLYGTNRIAANLIWYSDFEAERVFNQGGGGKGGAIGGGGKGGGSSNYLYFAYLAMALCEGVVSSIGQIFVSKQITDLPSVNGVLFNGAQGQSPWGFLVSNHPDEALGYTNLAYVAYGGFSFGTSTETPQFSYEAFSAIVFGTSQDCSPDQFFIDFLARAGMDSSNIGTFATCATYWLANNLLISPVIDEQQTALDWLQQIIAPLNAELVWYPSQGYVDAVPYGDSVANGNGVTYTPNLSPIYSIGDDDYIRDGDEDPVTCDREDMSDVYNQVPIEYLNRADQYNVETYTASDDSLVDEYGFRTAPTQTAHHITDPNVAQVCANLFMNRQIYRRNKYTFKLPWNYILLDPMDLLAINDTNLGLVNQLVQIIDISEDESTGALTFNTEEVPNAIAGAAVFPNFGVTRSTPNYNLDAGGVNAPFFFEAPLALLQAAEVEIDVAISGANPLWGGCDIWISTDNMTYKYLAQFNTKTRMGELTAMLASFTPAGTNNIDNSNTLSIDMTESDGSFNNAATTADALALNTLCYVDGELIAYGNDVLTAPNKYDLTYLNRGCYGTPIGAHASGTPFAAYDQGVFRYQIDQTRVGQTLYFKFVSYNAWGGGIEEIAEVSDYSYTVLGTALLTPLANVGNLETNFFGDIAQLNWEPITDIRTPIFYEIRKGTTFASAQIIGTTTQTSFRVTGSDTYWVTGLYITPLGISVYSASPPSIAITTPALVQNVLGSWDEEATFWTGTKTNCSIVGSNLVTTAGQTMATYTAPSGHVITTNSPTSARVTINWAVAAANAASDVVTIADITAVPDITFASVQSNVQTIPQVNLDGGAWQNWSPGVYSFTTSIDFQLLINISDTNYQAVLSGFSFEVDVDDLFVPGAVTTSAGAAVAVTFPNQFNTVPIVNLTNLNAAAGDDVIITAGPTSSGFSVEVLNSGSRVVRNLTYQAQGW